MIESTHPFYQCMTVISQGRDRGSNEFSKNGSHFLSYRLQQLLYMPSRFYSVIVSSGFWLSIFSQMMKYILLW